MWVPHKELKKKKEVKKTERSMGVTEEGGQLEISFYFFSLYSFFSNSRVSNSQNSSG